MKKLAALAVVMAMALVGSGVVYADLTDGLVAYYPFNGNADDESENGNDGTVSGAILTEDRFGSPDSAYRFDPTGGCDYIDVPASADFQLESWTVTGWIRLYSYSATYSVHIVTKSMDSSDKYNFAVSLLSMIHSYPIEKSFWNSALNCRRYLS